ncbi:hypothetical protein J3F84DRAFT_363583 [Trichoderma pleuroticola]
MHVEFFLVFVFLFLFSLIFLHWPIRSPWKVKDATAHFSSSIGLGHMANTQPIASRALPADHLPRPPPFFFFLPNPVPLSHL